MLLTLVWAPIPIGSNRVWSVALLQVGFFTLLGLWALAYAHRPFDLPGVLSRVRWPLMLLSAWALFPLLQLIPLPTGVAEALGGPGQALYREVPADLGTRPGFISLDRGATISGFLWQGALLAFLVCVLALTTSAFRVRTLMTVILLVGFAEAVYGLLIYFGGSNLGLWNPGHAAGAVSGTYVNQNHFAGLMEVTIPIGLGLLMCDLTDERSRLHPGGSFEWLLFILSGQRGLIIFFVLTMTASLILTTSRGGTGSLAVGIGMAVLLAGMRRGIRAREVKLGAVAAMLVVAALLWTGPGNLPEKIQDVGLTSQRGDLREISYQMIGDSPWLGTGVGTYRWVFPSYKDARFGGNFYEHAHNDFLEVLGEQGLIGFTLLASGLCLIGLRIVRAYGQRRDPLMRGALFASIAGCTSLLVHGLVDFNLQIPANAAYFVALLGLGLVGCYVSDKTEVATMTKHGSYGAS
jgi:O-antigen ligase